MEILHFQKAYFSKTVVYFCHYDFDQCLSVVSMILYRLNTFESVCSDLSMGIEIQTFYIRSWATLAAEC